MGKVVSGRGDLTGVALLVLGVNASLGDWDEARLAEASARITKSIIR